MWIQIIYVFFHILSSKNLTKKNTDGPWLTMVHLKIFLLCSGTKVIYAFSRNHMLNFLIVTFSQDRELEYDNILWCWVSDRELLASIQPSDRANKQLSDLINGLIHWWTLNLIALLEDDRSFQNWGLQGRNRLLGCVWCGHIDCLTWPSLYSLVTSESLYSILASCCHIFLLNQGQ
jgi:hypothetical protein